MNDAPCIFCNIIAGHIPATYIEDNEHAVVIKDIAPKAPIHYLIIPKKHIPDVASLSNADAVYASALILMAGSLSKQLPETGSFRLIMNNGADVGQTVFHLHCHFIAGKKMAGF